MGCRPPFVKNVEHQKQVKVNMPIKLILEADWPTPSWYHEFTEIGINEEEKIIIIEYLGSRNPGVAMQVIQSFKTEIDLTIPSSGSWKIIVKGRAENWESQIFVN